MDIRIYPPEEMLEASPALPLSKSQSNRLLIINAICGMPATAAKTAECDDTKAMIAALESGADTINIGGAGTAMRFLTAYFAAMPGRDVTIDGDDRMRQRPIGGCITGLRSGDHIYTHGGFSAAAHFRTPAHGRHNNSRLHRQFSVHIRPADDSTDHGQRADDTP